MIKHVKKHFLLSTVLFSLLLFSCICSSFASPVYAAEATIQEKGPQILNNVVGLDMTKYTVTTNEIPAEQQISYFDVRPMKDIGYDLTSEESKVKTLFTFVDGNLQMIHVLETEGPPILTTPATSTNAAEMAEDFLRKYQVYTADSLYGELKDTLVDVDSSKNATITSGNTQLEVSAVDDYTTFKWTYTFNGVKAPSKVVALGFKNGFLKYFVDNWNLYRIGSTNISLSKDKAVAIALETARTYNWSVKLDADTLDIKNFNETNVRWTSLIFDDSVGTDKARSEDLLMLYPVWRVGIALDKWYGNMYGIEVDIWADTKEVRRAQEAWSTLLPPEGVPTADVSTVGASTSQVMWIALPTLAVAMLGTVLFWTSKKKNLTSHKLLKLLSSKTGGILLCTLIAATLLVFPTATVNATTRAGVVWGSESWGAGEYPDSWRKHQTEIDLQRTVANNINSYFVCGGYSGFNNQGFHGSTSEKYAILTTIQYLQNNYDYVAVVDFDHGGTNYPGYPAPPSEWHYMFEDNRGTWYDGGWHPEAGVYDMHIYQYTQGNKIIFAFISTCRSADLNGQGYISWGWPPYPGRARGMTYAWTHRRPGIDMSTDGYLSPDTVSQVYIGFPYGSASLMQRIPYPSGTKQYKWWVQYFFYYGVYHSMSVNQALDQASLATWPGDNFGASPLRNGFTSYWWNVGLGYGCTMAVYGNGNIQLKQYQP